MDKPGYPNLYGIKLPCYLYVVELPDAAGIRILDLEWEEALQPLAGEGVQHLEEATLEGPRDQTEVKVKCKPLTLTPTHGYRFIFYFILLFNLSDMRDTKVFLNAICRMFSIFFNIVESCYSLIWTTL